MAIDFTVSQNMATGATANFVDTSTGVTFSNVLAIRLVIGNYLIQQQQNVLTSGNTMEQWRMYQSKTLTGYTYDNILIPFGGEFISFLSNGTAVQSGSEMLDMGQYSEYIAPATYLPTTAGTPYILTPDNSGVEAEGNGSFPDGIYWGIYDQYVISSPNPIVNAVENTQYIVAGSSGTATLDGNIYPIGYVFIAGSNNAVSYTGTATLRVLSQTKFKYFAFTYNVRYRLVQIQLYVAQNCICNKALQDKIGELYQAIEAVEFAAPQNLTTASVMSDILIDVAKELTIIENDLRL